MANLRALGTRFERLAPIRKGRCGAQVPLRVSALAGGIDLEPAAIMNCRTATALTQWVTFDVALTAARVLGDTPTALTIGSHYQCRTVNRRPGARLSQHALANAVDIMAIDFAERASLSIARQPAGTPEARFQAAIRKASCRIFTTVLGPGSDRFHSNHLHLDMAQRRNDYRVCE